MVLFSVWQHQHNIYLFEFTSSPPRLSIQLMDNGGDKFEVVVVSIDPNFPVYLHNDYFSVKHGKKESSAVMLKSDAANGLISPMDARRPRNDSDPNDSR
ncbi:paired amphipathic helix protein Sin3-like 2 isoform X2 [Capsicum annuum]|uniref:paired amphipathic helix protein Sin3-like 2 isoform X2 n=1 Tax=Capsicum annuum TaxID=4072 RepID=UPI0007BFBA08|nr:paired amphipathic helix protein Sin3-like 2 isoform X2 [Capsicum annuum]